MMYRGRRQLVLARVTEIRRTGDTFYEACSQCYTKICYDANRHKWICEKCGRTFTAPMLRYRLLLTINDGSIKCAVAVFGKNIDTFLGAPAAEFDRYIRGLKENHLYTDGLLGEALATTFVGKMFYFGFKASLTKVLRESKSLKLADIVSSSSTLQQSSGNIVAFQMFPAVQDDKENTVTVINCLERFLQTQDNRSMTLEHGSQLDFICRQCNCRADDHQCHNGPQSMLETRTDTSILKRSVVGEQSSLALSCDTPNTTRATELQCLQNKSNSALNYSSMINQSSKHELDPDMTVNPWSDSHLSIEHLRGSSNVNSSNQFRLSVIENINFDESMKMTSCLQNSTAENISKIEMDHCHHHIDRDESECEENQLPEEAIADCSSILVPLQCPNLEANDTKETIKHGVSFEGALQVLNNDSLTEPPDHGDVTRDYPLAEPFPENLHPESSHMTPDGSLLDPGRNLTWDTMPESEDLEQFLNNLENKSPETELTAMSSHVEERKGDIKSLETNENDKGHPIIEKEENEEEVSEITHDSVEPPKPNLQETINDIPFSEELYEETLEEINESEVQEPASDSSSCLLDAYDSIPPKTTGHKSVTDDAPFSEDLDAFLANLEQESDMIEACVKADQLDDRNVTNVFEREAEKQCKSGSPGIPTCGTRLCLSSVDTSGYLTAPIMSPSELSAASNIPIDCPQGNTHDSGLVSTTSFQELPSTIKVGDTSTNTIQPFMKTKSCSSRLKPSSETTIAPVVDTSRTDHTPRCTPTRPSSFTSLMVPVSESFLSSFDGSCDMFEQSEDLFGDSQVLSEDSVESSSAKYNNKGVSNQLHDDSSDSVFYPDTSNNTSVVSVEAVQRKNPKRKSVHFPSSSKISEAENISSIDRKMEKKIGTQNVKVPERSCLRISESFVQPEGNMTSVPDQGHQRTIADLFTVAETPVLRRLICLNQRNNISNESLEDCNTAKDTSDSLICGSQDLFADSPITSKPPSCKNSNPLESTPVHYSNTLFPAAQRPMTSENIDDSRSLFSSDELFSDCDEELLLSVCSRFSEGSEAFGDSQDLFDDS